MHLFSESLSLLACSLLLWAYAHRTHQYAWLANLTASLLLAAFAAANGHVIYFLFNAAWAFVALSQGRK